MPKDAGGTKNDSISKYVIFRLVAIYQLRTNNMPKCGWVDENDKHVGEFYDFLIDLIPALKELDIDLGTKKSVGTYAVEILRDYRKWQSDNS